jgi:hypothetical protein
MVVQVFILDTLNETLTFNLHLSSYPFLFKRATRKENENVYNY